MRPDRLLAIVALCASAAGALAQSYPSKSIRIVVGFPPGGGNDIIARLVGAKMQEAWGQPVVIDNKPSAASITAVIAGDVQMTIVDTPPLVPQIKAGRVKALGVTSAKRSASMPEVPALAETVPGYEMVLWIGVFAPAGTPGEVASKLNAEVVRIVKLPEVRETLDAMGVEPLGNTSAQMAEWIRREIGKYGPVVKAANIKAE